MEPQDNPNQPTMFEYYKKHTGKSAYFITSKSEFDFMDYSNHAKYGEDFGATVEFTDKEADDQSIWFHGGHGEHGDHDEEETERKHDGKERKKKRKHRKSKKDKNKEGHSHGDDHHEHDLNDNIMRNLNNNDQFENLKNLDDIISKLSTLLCKPEDMII